MLGSDGKIAVNLSSHFLVIITVVHLIEQYRDQMNTIIRSILHLFDKNEIFRLKLKTSNLINI